MLVKTNSSIGLLSRVDQALEAADKNRTFENGLSIAKEVMGLLGIENAQADLKSFPRLKVNSSWTRNAPDYEDRKASFALAENNTCNIDFKLFWVTKPAKRIISNLVALTPNFEDEQFYSNKNIGIDFVLTENADRLLIILSNNYKIRSLEIHKRLSNTQKKILEKWAQDFDFSNKLQVHKVLWDSFDIQPLNKEFYIEISSFFNELIQYFEKKDILDKKHCSQFVNRLIGRIIFCWFLRKKEIITDDTGYFDTDGKSGTEYYTDKLETLFFKVLNTPIEERGSGINDKTPFLNGGLFEPKKSDLFGLHKLSFPADYFDRLYSFLNRYNFTTDENTSDFQQVAIDPEMLGCIFENLLAEETEETGEQARKAKGAFYTPRKIVDYMCRESLRAFVSEKLGDDARKDEVLQLLFDKKEHELDLKGGWGNLGAYKNRIVEALDEIKIIDPACGSGAFPIGMLQTMLSIYERLDTRLDHYKTKLSVIKNNIFGVDIEPMAVEISRLRTWLSLVVDVAIKPTEKNMGIAELPNLDFKFACANSLIPLLDTDQEDLFDTVKADELVEIRDKYFNARTWKSKEELRKRYEKKIQYKKTDDFLVSKREKQLRSYHPFDADNIANFFDPEFMFGITGFDIVIGNPPWGQKSVKFSESEKVLFKKIYPSATIGILDISRLFIERAITILNSNGSFANVLPDIILLKNYDSTRKFILDNLLMTSIDHWGMAFENVNLDSCTLIGKKWMASDRNNNVVACTVHADNGIISNKIPQSQFLQTEGYKFNLYLCGEIRDLLNKLKKEKSFGDFFDPHEGIHSGNIRDKLFINKKINNNCKKLIFGRDEISKYYLFWNGKWVNYDKNIINKVNGEYAGLGKPEYFEKHKIVVRRTGDYILGAFDGAGYYFSNNAFVCVPKKDSEINMKYVLAILNSKLATWFYRTVQPRKGKLFAELKINVLKQIPIKETSTDNQKQIIELVDKIISVKKENSKADAGSIEDVIDQLIFDIFMLSKEQRQVIEKSQ
jgi:hypothetical protein